MDHARGGHVSIAFGSHGQSLDMSAYAAVSLRPILGNSSPLVRALTNVCTGPPEDVSDMRAALLLTSGMCRVKHLIAHKLYGANAFREALRDQGASPLFPADPTASKRSNTTSPAPGNATWPRSRFTALKTLVGSRADMISAAEIFYLLLRLL